ncbi:ParB/RepB/Spo0J family partition protein [Shinella zoogloeoides]|uniref:ParB/RepB/Spo0J family partition protein n=1 Tax=Shinella zoogloeoides TaxID=352475 RepID=UPI00273FE554|nr:ParB/RepB/Spo0J family partition protein [Shinella zoogloeoides]WLR90980.1 ParB/RepB/Spo0J family partition protein [Shinella zoogloeoides]
MSQPQLLNLDPQMLTPNPWNTNIVSPDNETKLEESIRRNGLFKPVIVRELPVLKLSQPAQPVYEIIGGEHRWQVAKKIGLAQIPVVNLGQIDDKRAKEISVLDNARYGADDTLSFAELLKGLGDVVELQSFLPFGDEDLTTIFSSADIALDDLEIDGNFERAEGESDAPEPPAAKAPKTHTVMRFKVSLRDAERLTALIARTQKAQGLTDADDLTNAGDALVHLLVDQFEVKASAGAFQLDEIDAALAEVAA